jgi:threonylcarbamoyladenosine tRNA methylthiotransferase MtaB
VVLTGVQLGSWGDDLEGGLDLVHVLEAILGETDIPRVRVSSLEPWDVELPLIEMFTSDRVAGQMHLPLQSGCAETLKRMARKNTPAEYRELINLVRKVDPEMAITTDIMVGFPGETEEEFLESLSFVKEMEFADAHVFTYSERPGTKAARLPDQVDHRIRKERNALMREAVAASARAYRESFLGCQKRVLWESSSREDGQRWKMYGLTGNYLRVETSSGQDLWNQITSVKFISLTEKGLKGVVQA